MHPLQTHAKLLKTQSRRSGCRQHPSALSITGRPRGAGQGAARFDRSELLIAGRAERKVALIKLTVSCGEIPGSAHIDLAVKVGI